MSNTNNSSPHDALKVPYPDTRIRDPQVVVMGTLKESNSSDVITFSVRLALFEIVCIVTVPEQGTKTAPVYVKFKVNKQ